MSEPLQLPAPAPDPERCLETRGPMIIPRVNYTPGNFAPMLTFEEWKKLPNHLKEPKEECPEFRDHMIACRIYRLVKRFKSNDPLVLLHLEEIRHRLLILHPDCDEP